MICVLAQLNFTVGDIEKNAEKICAAVQAAQDKYQADIVVFPELALSGYPPEDLLLRKDFLARIQQYLMQIKASLPENIIAIIGYPEYDVAQDNIYNSAAILRRGKCIAHYRKQILPNYGVFDEKRYFTAGTDPCVFEYKHCRIGVVICEDLWTAAPVAQLKAHGAQMMISLNASPFHMHKHEVRLAMMQKRIQETGLSLLYVNHIGGQDDLIFDGCSFALNAQGQFIAQAPFGEEALLCIPPDDTPEKITSQLSDNARIYQALVLGVQDYFRKHHAKKALLGFSGGIDSALTLAIAADALGKENVLPVILPSRYTSALSITSAQQQLTTMGIVAQTFPIEELYSLFVSQLNVETESITAQNLQARIRAVMLMALSNNSGALLLNTSNKSETAVGYSTLYGDMCGAYAVIKDLWKTQVYQVARYRNSLSPIIPEDIILRPPSAELAYNQADSDTLPPYDILDTVLKKYIEDGESKIDIIQQGFEAEMVDRVVSLIVQNEYKRKQSPPGPRVSKLAFTRERRYPVTSAFDAKV